MYWFYNEKNSPLPWMKFSVNTKSNSTAFSDSNCPANKRSKCSTVSSRSSGNTTKSKPSYSTNPSMRYPWSSHPRNNSKFNPPNSPNLSVLITLLWSRKETLRSWKSRFCTKRSSKYKITKPSRLLSRNCMLLRIWWSANGNIMSIWENRLTRKCWWLRRKNKSRWKSFQGRLLFKSPELPTIRASRITSSRGGTEHGIRYHQNPEKRHYSTNSSLIFKFFFVTFIFDPLLFQTTDRWLAKKKYSSK